MKYFISLMLVAFALTGKGFAGGVGSGGSPPAKLLPESQFNEVATELLKGEAIYLLKDGIETPYEASEFDLSRGTITVVSPTTEEVYQLQNFDKKFGKFSNLGIKGFKKIPALTIPKNPEVLTTPSDSAFDEGVIGSGGSPPSSTQSE